MYKHRNTKHKNIKQWKHKCDNCELTFKNLASLESHKIKDKQTEDVSKSDEEKKKTLMKALFYFDDVRNLNKEQNN